MSANAHPPIPVLGVGMMTPVGLNAAQTTRSIRAGVTRIQESPFVDEHLAFYKLGYLDEGTLPAPKPELEQQLPALTRRLLQLASDPLEEAAFGVWEPGDLPVYLSLPVPLPDRNPLPGNFLNLLAQQSGVAFDVPKSRCFLLGRAGFFSALAQAVQVLQKSGGPDKVLVGGLDSYFDPWVLSHYRTLEDRILGDHCSDGFLPGEGAAFLLLGRPGSGSREFQEPLALLRGVGLGEEEGHLYSDKPYTGDGLSAAFAALFESVQCEPVRTVFAGFNGENFWGKEWGVSLLRHSPRFQEGHQLLHPAEFLGDAGAALPAIMMGCAVLGLQRDQVPGPALVFASSDGPHRGAALLTRS